MLLWEYFLSKLEKQRAKEQRLLDLGELNMRATSFSQTKEVDQSSTSSGAVAQAGTEGNGRDGWFSAQGAWVAPDGALESYLDVGANAASASSTSPDDKVQRAGLESAAAGTVSVLETSSNSSENARRRGEREERDSNVSGGGEQLSSAGSITGSDGLGDVLDVPRKGNAGSRKSSQQVKQVENDLPSKLGAPQWFYNNLGQKEWKAEDGAIESYPLKIIPCLEL